MVCATVLPKALGAIHTDDLKDLNNTRRGARCIMPWRTYLHSLPVQPLEGI